MAHWVLASLPGLSHAPKQPGSPLRNDGKGNVLLGIG